MARRPLGRPLAQSGGQPTLFFGWVGVSEQDFFLSWQADLFAIDKCRRFSEEFPQDCRRVLKMLVYRGVWCLISFAEKKARKVCPAICGAHLDQRLESRKDYRGGGRRSGEIEAPRRRPSKRGHRAGNPVPERQLNAEKKAYKLSRLFLGKFPPKSIFPP
jgi:hypothetical protein